MELVKRTCRLAELLRGYLGEPTVDLVTRGTGALVRSALEREIGSLPQGAVLVLDFEGVGIIDFSCADEVFAKLLSRMQAGEYGGRYLVLTGLTEGHIENIGVALERKKLSVAHLTGKEEDGAAVLGVLNRYLEETLGLVQKAGSMTAAQLKEDLSLELNAASTRLINLHKKGLILRREEGLKEGGRQYLYLPLTGDAQEREA